MDTQFSSAMNKESRLACLKNATVDFNVTWSSDTNFIIRLLQQLGQADFGYTTAEPPAAS